MGSILDDLCMYYILAHLVEYDNVMVGSYIVPSSSSSSSSFPWCVWQMWASL